MSNILCSYNHLAIVLQAQVWLAGLGTPIGVTTINWRNAR